MPQHDSDADCHFAASTIAAVVNFPLWRASAIAQSGFRLEGSNFIIRYYQACIQPPFRGVGATVAGMAWARGAIFYGSEAGKDYLNRHGYHPALSSTLPPLVVSTFVQFVNMPLVRATVTIQEPKCELKNVREALVHIYKTRGIKGLWHGVSAGVMKTVPKYITAVLVKDWMEDHLPAANSESDYSMGSLERSAIKSVAAGVTGAALTNPLDVLRNEMFKTDLSVTATLKKLLKEEGWNFATRGMTSNITAVAIPIAMTIFVTDILKTFKHHTLKL